MDNDSENIIRTLAEGMVLCMQRIERLERNVKFLEEYNKRHDTVSTLLSKTDDLLYDKLKKLHEHVDDLKQTKSKTKKKTESTEEMGDVLKFLLKK